jgi:hypothetical protein
MSDMSANTSQTEPAPSVPLVRNRFANNYQQVPRQVSTGHASRYELSRG